MITTEFFKTLKEAEEFKPICNEKEVFSLDKFGTIRDFRMWHDEAVSCGRFSDGMDYRAVVVIYR